MLESRLAEALATQYTIEGEIGRGGMGVVFKAMDEKLKRTVAIKVLPPELAYRPDIRQRFLREAETAARLSHPHIVPIHSVGEVENTVYFVMGLVEGESLAVRIKRRGRLSIDEARRIMKECADALSAAHQQGVIHRDVKPDNILLEGTRGRVMVTDFGIAKALTAVGGTLTEAGVAIGTPAFMSPEQAAGEREIDGRSDLYSLGVVAYQMLTGELPFQAPSVPALLMKQITEKPISVDRKRPEVPKELSQTVMRCLEKEPEDRWPTADALRRALETNTFTAAPARSPSRGSRRAGQAVEADGESGQALPPGRRMSREQARDWLSERGAELPAERPARPSRRVRHKDDEKAREEREIEALAKRTGEPVMITRFRHRIAMYAAVNGMLVLLNIATTQLDPPWAIFPIVFWGFGLAKDYAKLWTAGYSWRDVVNRPPAPDAIVGPKAAAASARALPQGRVTVTEFGSYVAAIEQARSDRAAVMAMLEKMPKSERKMLPDVGPTVDGLVERATDLARTLAQLEKDIDESSVDKVDARIAELEREGVTPDKERRLALLQQQRGKVAQLFDRRAKLQSQFEACTLAMQNVRFDLLRLRSAGVGAALEDLTMATQQARALSRDVDAAIDAAGEVRRLTGQEDERR